MFDLKGKAKWDAWEAKKDMTHEAAQQAYIDLITDLLQWEKTEKQWLKKQ